MENQNQEQKQEQEEVIHINKEEKKVDYTKMFFGLAILIVGILYLGNSMSIWNVEFNSVFIWPVFVILAGILIMGNRLILRILIIIAAIFMFIMIASMLFYHLNSYQDAKEFNDLKGAVVGVDMSNMSMQAQKQSFGLYRSESGEYDYHFSANNIGRWQLEERIKQVLDDLYSPNMEQELDVEFSIRKIQ